MRVSSQPKACSGLEVVAPLHLHVRFRVALKQMDKGAQSTSEDQHLTIRVVCRAARFGSVG